MSNAFFHLLGPGTQPDDASFSMNPLPLTCQVNGDPSMAALERCAHSPAVMALLTDLRGQLAGASRKSATCWDGSYLP